MSDTKIKTPVKTRITIAVNSSVLEASRYDGIECPRVNEAYHNASFIGHHVSSKGVYTVLIMFESDVPDIDMLLKSELNLAVAEFVELPGNETFAIMSESPTSSGWNKIRHCGAAEEFNFDQACYRTVKPINTPLPENHSIITSEGIQPGAMFRHHSGRVYKVLFLANTRHLEPKHPITVIYEGANGSKWSKSLGDFIVSMKLLKMEQELQQA